VNRIKIHVENRSYQQHTLSFFNITTFHPANRRASRYIIPFSFNNSAVSFHVPPPPPPLLPIMASFNAPHTAALDAVSREQRRRQLQGMTPHDRHKAFMHDLVTYYGGSLPAPSEQAASHPTAVKTDLAALKESYRFIRSSADDAAAEEDSWVRLAQRYYAKLYREYAIVDLSRYREGKIGMRWRTQKEVVAGRGHLTCGARGCEERLHLASFEVPFGYDEAGTRKAALVKVRVCPEHGRQLNFKREHKKRKRESREVEKGRAEDSEDEDGVEGKERKNRRLDRSKHAAEREKDGSAAERVEADDEAERHEPRDRNDIDGFEAFFAGLLE
jgi:protein FRA10AC1